MMKKYKNKILLGLLGIFVIIQFFPIDKTNPPIETTKDFITMTAPSSEMQKHLEVACYDCHAHTTKYPWYSSVAPISFWTKGHVDNGRKHLNFSLWGEYSQNKKNHKLEECIEMMEKNWMPLLTYKWLHPNSKLNESQREDMIAFFKSQIKN